MPRFAKSILVLAALVALSHAARIGHVPHEKASAPRARAALSLPMPTAAAGQAPGVAFRLFVTPAAVPGGGRG
ncbi:hypothetical protein E0K89_005890 [Aquicoccus sp. SCR17]|nr:hypothetical protein [Carideicomes alvinocaridis]